MKVKNLIISRLKMLYEKDLMESFEKSSKGVTSKKSFLKKVNVMEKKIESQFKSE